MLHLSELENQDAKTIEELLVVHYYNGWQDGLEKFSNLKKLMLYWRSETPNYPPGIPNLKKLEYLYFDSDDTTELPNWLREMTQIKTLIIKDTKVKVMPDWLTEMDNLETLHFEEGNLQKISPKIGNMKNIKILNFQKNKLTSVPSSIGELKQLKELYLERNKIKDLAPEFFQLTNLEVLNLWRNKLPQWYPEFSNFKQLRDFYWEANDFKANTDIVETLFQLKKHNPRVNKGEDKKLGRLAQAAKAVNPDGKHLESFISLYKNDTSSFSKIPLEALLLATQMKGTTPPDSALEEIWTRGKENLVSTPLTKGSKIVILGKTNFKKSELKQQLEDLGLIYQNAISEDVTHIVMGPGGKLEKSMLALLKTKAIFIAEEDIRDYINQHGDQYLLKNNDGDNQQNIEHLRALLMSENDDDTGVAIELIKGGGLPPEVLTELFIVYKYKGTKKYKKKAKDLLMLHGSKGLQTAIKNKIRKLTSHTTDRLYEFTEGTELEQWKLNQYIYLNLKNFIVRSTKHNLLKDAIETAPEKVAKSFIQQVMTKWCNNSTQFIWHSYLDFGTYGAASYRFNQVETYIVSYVYWEKQPTAFPPGIKQLIGLTRLDLSFNLGAIGNIPDEVFELINLEKLKLEGTSLTELSPKIKQLKKLTTLDLRNNDLTTLPKEITELKNLKMIQIRGAFSTGLNFDINALREAMDWCAILE